ncbi:hypothetical protein BZA05DRAFT_390187 [Tricharina praecox]|uniref:uncharacterized protein n=1 Tax=Tricharina praecox TaxID=43433 RepID=UPI002220967C|nr:uncharacterized protein BZA05DRAFT_390187 [Tricharina praecox]KAI5855959.1 hypothetical protein BZA05DRAFT_390187 [Tricharina praecox]
MARCLVLVLWRHNSLLSARKPTSSVWPSCFVIHPAGQGRLIRADRKPVRILTHRLAAQFQGAPCTHRCGS